MVFETMGQFMCKLMFFHGFVNECGFPKPLTKEEETTLVEQMLSGNNEAREKLINHNLRLVVHIAKKYIQSAESEELISVGSIGLVKAVDSYKPNKGSSISTYASRCIENEMLMLLRANKKHKNDISLSDPIGVDKDGNELTLIDLLCEKDDTVYESVIQSIERDKLLAFIKSVLTEREYKVICLRYGLKGDRSYAQREVACFLKISRSYISRIETKAIEKLKDAVKKSQFCC